MSNRPFKHFFVKATGLPTGPHEYQAHLAECQSLPDILAVPTGCGKTAAAVLSWAWRRRTCPDPEIRKRTPRRLVYCLPMRSLVEQVHEEIIIWLRNLDWINHTQPLTASYRPNWSRDEVPVFRLMGGEESEEWEGHPEREAVLVGTQDMLLSRALNRGYAMKPTDWPIAFGLVNVDALWILDETQLMGSGRTTSVQLHQFRRTPQHLPCESLWMSATISTNTRADSQLWTQPAPLWMRTPEHGEQDVTVVGLGQTDRKAMSKLLTGPKRVERPDWVSESPSLPEQLLRYASGGRLVIVIVNRVTRAQELYRRIKALMTRDDGHPDTLLLHSRFRPYERSSAMGKLKTPTPACGRIVISTQVIEAGVDLDADVLVTEICPWPSLVQRLGRLNRRGEKEGVALLLNVHVQEPTNGWPKKRLDHVRAIEEARRKAALPYEYSDLEAAWDRVEQLGVDASISSIERVDQKEPYQVPVEGQVLRRHHLDDLFDTDPDLSGGHIDVSRFVRADSLDLDVAVLWRALQHVSPEDSPAPHPDEICKVSIGDLRTLGGQLGSDDQGWLLTLQHSRDSRQSGAWVGVRLDPRMAASVIRPGDTVMLDVSAGGYDSELGWEGSRLNQPTCCVGVVNGHRSWVQSDGTLVGDIDGRVDGWTDLVDDPRSYGYRWMELLQHLSLAESNARQLATTLVPDMADRLATAGRWHDIGKALERDDADGPLLPFQEMLRSSGSADSPHPREGVFYAKSNRFRRTQKSRHRFRHEVASVLAYLASDDADTLVAWLIMAHHGKVRMTPIPWDDDRLDDIAGVRCGDRVPARAMSFVAQEEACILAPDLLRPHLEHPGWQGRAVKLLENHGHPFLAYLEALLRVADWRASR